ncbi:PTS sugar transporter subunit IIA [Pelagibacterium sediminicola]|uniref:PTS sugar transporter subunit IIA n=1 Tax=Pelagibacterium sediminicola TaxID=2248761 RepID=UPI000E31F3CC|nr:PTS sugar transporter subunit IIA [Pelagibacterium sediminicola]
MIGLVLVTHGKLAEEFKSALEHVVGPQEAVAAVSIGPDDDMEARRNDIITAIETVEEGEGVIVLTDMFGGTPSNLAISVMQDRNVEVLCGLNLPMLVKLARVRSDMDIREAARFAAEAGRKYINVANDFLGK